MLRYPAVTALAAAALVLVLAAGLTLAVRHGDRSPPPSRAGTELNPDPEATRRAALDQFRRTVEGPARDAERARRALPAALGGPGARRALGAYAGAARTTRTRLARLRLPPSLRNPAALAANGLERAAGTAEDLAVHPARVADPPRIARLLRVARAQHRRMEAFAAALRRPIRRP